MDSYSADAKEFDDESSEEEYDVDGIVPDTNYNNNNSPMLHSNNYHHGKRDKSSSSSRENYKRNKTHAAMVHHDDRAQPRSKTRTKQPPQQQQQHKQQPYYHDERSHRRKKKVTSSKKKHYEASYDEEEGLFASPVYRDELDSSFPPPRLSDFDEMFQRAASNRQQRRKHDPEDHQHLELDQGLGKPGEQYYLDLAGNIRKVNFLSHSGFCINYFFGLRKVDP